MPGKKYFSEQHRRNISNAKNGHKVSLETRKKISLANKGKHHSTKTEFKKGHKSRTGMKTSKETKLKLRLSHLGKKHSQEHKRKISESNKGKVISQKTRQKISKALTGKKRPDISKIRKGMTFSKEHRKNIGLAHLGFTPWNKNKKGYKIHSKEWLLELSKKMKGNKNCLGKKASLITKLKMSKSHKGIIPKNIFKKGEEHYNWQGGKSFEPYGLAFNKELKEAIRARDGHRCQECFKHESELFTKKGKSKKLACHHIDYNKQNNTPSNLISLCQKCHCKTNFKRKDWTKYLQNKKGGI